MAAHAVKRDRSGAYPEQGSGAISREKSQVERLVGWQKRYPDVSVDRVVVDGRPAAQLLDHAEAAQRSSWQ